MKTCSKCLVEKPLADFSRSYVNKGGLRGECKACRKVHDAWYHKNVWYPRNKDILKSKPSHQPAEKHRRRLQKYGLTPTDYAALQSKQNGLCAICQKKETILRKGAVCKLAVDHNHKSGKVRGLLCNKCNLIIGKLRDDPAWAESIALYLRTNS